MFGKERLERRRQVKGVVERECGSSRLLEAMALGLREAKRVRRSVEGSEHGIVSDPADFQVHATDRQVHHDPGIGVGLVGPEDPVNGPA